MTYSLLSTKPPTYVDRKIRSDQMRTNSRPTGNKVLQKELN